MKTPQVNALPGMSPLGFTQHVTPFETALNELPEGTGFDSFAHKTPEDLAWVCLHELDMHSEGECRIPLTLRKKYYAFCLKWGNDYIKEESKDAYEQGLTQKNFAY